MNSVRWLEGIALLTIVIMGILPWRWQTCVKAALVVLVVEGAIRKWFLPSLSQFIYFGKDALFIAAYLKYLIERSGSRTLRPDPMLSLLVVTAVCGVLFQAGNYKVGSPVIGIMGARNYLVYLPLMYIGRHLFKDESDLASFIKWYVLLCLPVVGLATVQYFSPPGSAINVYLEAEETSQALTGSRVRATGTFSYIAGFSTYLQTMAAFVIPLLVIRHKGRWELLFRLTLGCIAGGIVLSGSRSIFLFAVGFLGLYFVLNRTFWKLRLYRRFAVPIVVIGFSGLAYFSDAIVGYAERFTGNQDLFMRVLIIFTTPLDYSLEAGFFGFGAGATYQANAKIRQLFGLPPGIPIPVYFEGEPERVMLELGPVIFLTWYALRIRIAVLLWGTYRQLKRPLLRELALTALISHLLALPAQVVFQATYSVYYWFMAGFIFLLPAIEQREMDRDASSDEDWLQRRARHTTRERRLS